MIAIGFLLIGISTYYYTNLTLMTSFGFIVLPNIILGVGVILTFIPISGLVLGTLPKSELSNGAGLHSLAKCVSTVLSISLSSTMVSRLSQAHQTYLVENLSNTNPIFFHRLSLMTHKFMSNLPEFSAMHKAGGVFYHQMITQARIFAYSDAFALFALVAFLMIPLGFVMKVKFDDKDKKSA